jgi:DNA-binding transcriptional ArsR family regulator
MMDTDAPDVTDGHAGGNRGISPALDATLDLLSDRRRRYVLYSLREQSGATPVEELAEQITSWEEGDADTQRILADLYHSQLPRLDEAGAVAFDADEGYVTLTENNDLPLEAYLDLAAAEENFA